MAQIIKHRRGSIENVATTTARKGEIILATGSVDTTLGGPFVFIGNSDTQGDFRTLSKIYNGSSAPNLTLGTWGSSLNGTPFYASSNKTLYILSNAGNTAMDFTGNIEGNLINNVKITSLTGGTVSVTGLTDNRLVVVGANGLLEDDANLTFDGSVFNIGQGQFEVDVASGNIRTSGSIVMKGNIEIGDSNTDNIILAGEVSSSIIPDVNEAFDLGSPTQAWRDLYVSGTAYIEHINIGAISTTNLDLPGDLVVSGTTILSGSVYLDNLTEKRLVVVGTDGLLTDYNGLTFDNGNLNLSGALEVTDIQGTGSLFLKPDKNDSRLFEIYNTGGSDIHIKGNTTYNFFGDDTNFLKIDTSANTLTLDSTNGVLIDIDTTVSQSLSVDGHINLTGTRQIRVSDNTANTIYGFFDGSNILGSYYQMFGNNYSTVDQRGSSEFVFDSRNGGGSGFNVAEFNGSTWLRRFRVAPSGVEVTGTTTLNGTLTVTGETTLQDNLIVSGTTTISGDTYVEYLTQNRVLLAGANGHIEDNNNLVFDTTKLQVGMGTFEVDVFDGDIRTSGSLTVEGGQTINGGMTVNGQLNVTGNTYLQSNLYVSGNVEFLSGATYVHISSSIVEIGDNIILVNAYSPFERYAGIAGYDSGSMGQSGSLLWDSLNNYWLLENGGNGSQVIGTTAASMGSEISLTTNKIPKATSSNTIGDSLLVDDGTIFSYNTNKFVVTGSTGETLIYGNVTLSSGGGLDAGSKTSAILFRNSSNVLGYVSTTESSSDVLDGILGYQNSDGMLKFSTVIDGGLY